MCSWDLCPICWGSSFPKKFHKWSLLGGNGWHKIDPSRVSLVSLQSHGWLCGHAISPSVIQKGTVCFSQFLMSCLYILVLKYKPMQAGLLPIFPKENAEGWNLLWSCKAPPCWPNWYISCDTHTMTSGQGVWGGGWGEGFRHNSSMLEVCLPFWLFLNGVSCRLVGPNVYWVSIEWLGTKRNLRNESYKKEAMAFLSPPSKKK